MTNGITARRSCLSVAIILFFLIIFLQKRKRGGSDCTVRCKSALSSLPSKHYVSISRKSIDTRIQILFTFIQRVLGRQNRPQKKMVDHFLMIMHYIDLNISGVLV